MIPSYLAGAGRDNTTTRRASIRGNATPGGAADGALLLLLLLLRAQVELQLQLRWRAGEDLHRGALQQPRLGAGTWALGRFRFAFSPTSTSR